MWKFSHTIKNVFFLTNRKEPLHWPISPSSCKFFFCWTFNHCVICQACQTHKGAHQLFVLYYIIQHDSNNGFEASTWQVLHVRSLSWIKNLKLLKCIIQLSSFIHLCKHQISLASVGQILFGLEKKSLMVKSGLPTCQNLSKYKIFFSVKLFLATYLLTRPEIILTNIKNCLA